jgi:hypothetical protein
MFTFLRNEPGRCVLSWSRPRHPRTASESALAWSSSLQRQPRSRLVKVHPVPGSPSSPCANVRYGCQSGWQFTVSGSRFGPFRVLLLSMLRVGPVDAKDRNHDRSECHRCPETSHTSHASARVVCPHISPITCRERGPVVVITWCRIRLNSTQGESSASSKSAWRGLAPFPLTAPLSTTFRCVRGATAMGQVRDKFGRLSLIGFEPGK